MAPVERQKPDDNTKLKEQLILQFLHRIYSLVVGGQQHARWKPSTTTLEKRRLACLDRFSVSYILRGSRTLIAFEILLGKSLSTSSDIKAGITLDACERRLLEFGKEILLTHNPEQKLPDTIDFLFLPGQRNKTKYRRQIFYDQVKHIMHEWYSLSPPLPGTDDDFMKQRIHVTNLQYTLFRYTNFTFFNCNLLDIINTTQEILEKRYNGSCDIGKLIEAIASLRPLPGEELNDNNREMLKRFQFVLEQTRIFDGTTFNCCLPDIITKTLQILGKKQGTSDDRKNLLAAVVSLQPLPGEELDGCNNVINFLEKHARPEHMEHFHLLRAFLDQNAEIAEHNKAILQELIRLKLLSQAELTTLLWHLNHYHLTRKTELSELTIKHHSGKAPHLPRSLEINPNAIIVKFKSKRKKSVKPDKLWTGTFKQFSHRLHIDRITGKLVLKGELRPKHRTCRSSEKALQNYARLTARLFKDALSITEKIRKRGLTDCIVPLGEEIHSKKRPGAVYYQVPIVGNDLFDLLDIKKETLFTIINQALTKLKRIHDANLCSLDIKPENIIWTPTGELFFIDTESAIDLTEKPSLNPRDQRMKIMSLEFLAPEFYTNWRHRVKEKLNNMIIRYINHIQSVNHWYENDNGDSNYKTPLEQELMKLKSKTKNPSGDHVFGIDIGLLDEDILTNLNTQLEEKIPEEHRSAEKRANKAADVYALGKTIQILAMQTTYDNASTSDQNTKDSISALVKSMCAINPVERPTIEQAIDKANELFGKHKIKKPPELNTLPRCG